MSESFENRLRALGDVKSPLFCGSALYLSLIPVLRLLSKKVEMFHEGFPELEKINRRLFDEDPILFEYSKKENRFSAEEWKEAMLILRDYENEIRYLDALAKTCEAGEMMSFASLLRCDSLFLKRLLQDTLTIFSQKEDVPIEFQRVSYDCLNAIRGEWV